MATYLAYGNPNAVITTEKKCELLHDLLLNQLSGIGGKILVVPPDITRLPSNAGELTKILYQIWSETKGNQFDILPAIGTHTPMTKSQIKTMFGDLNQASYYDHNWRTGLSPLGEIPSDLVSEVSDGKVDYDISVAVNQRIIEGGYDLILSIGQVIPHEVAGMANGFKNVLIGTGGQEMINKSHFLGAADGIERLLGQTNTSVRQIFNYAHNNFLKKIGIIYIMTVMETSKSGKTIMRGLFAGNDHQTFEKAAKLSQTVNIDWLEKPLNQVVVYLDPIEFKSTWLGNKAIYRTRMAISDNGELIIVAPGLKEFGEDPEIDYLIRKYGYSGTETTLQQVLENEDLQANLSAAAHLIHGTSDGRFRVTYATSELSREEIESVGYEWADVNQVMSKFNIEQLTGGFNNELFFISNPAQGLWIAKGS
ncbi:D-mannonate epimerase [Candidatus Poribacteria bacterium]|nr:D-mannonate epimerase [Candidatus Poribacteria bacterium]